MNRDRLYRLLGVLYFIAFLGVIGLEMHKPELDGKYFGYFVLATLALAVVYSIKTSRTSIKVPNPSMDLGMEPSIESKYLAAFIFSVVIVILELGMLGLFVAIPGFGILLPIFFIPLILLWIIQLTMVSITFGRLMKEKTGKFVNFLKLFYIVLFVAHIFVILYFAK